LVLEGADLGTWDWDVVNGWVSFNHRWFEMLGYESHEIDHAVSAWEQRVHPDDFKQVMQALTDHLENRTADYQSEHRLKHKSGKWVWVLDKGRVIERDANGQPLRACGTHLDITQRK
jgi:PAS domain S-box-containing protein